ncbi:hypothetical protein [Robiginitalea sp. SC105]|uniref:hypothetical protein n=1 Tax=Robiginitalea sp. SC105 TaxID=2762332 RepID=UPI00163AB1B9|nr:hypothetical protein [Robiginitalea sp. SC105]MBC2838447.1 hypothetical protein [Robiginitalea sp. SC105]
MRRLFLVIVAVYCCQYQMQAQTVFELDGNQSMLMIGKGPGQDATINPFQGEDCFAVIENLGDELFSVRIQQEGEIVAIVPVQPQQTEKIKLLVGQELYLDPETKNKARASVDYEKIGN